MGVSFVVPGFGQSPFFSSLSFGTGAALEKGGVGVSRPYRAHMGCYFQGQEMKRYCELARLLGLAA